MYAQSKESENAKIYKEKVIKLSNLFSPSISFPCLCTQLQNQLTCGYLCPATAHHSRRPDTPQSPQSMDNQHSQEADVTVSPSHRWLLFSTTWVFPLWGLRSCAGAMEVTRTCWKSVAGSGGQGSHTVGNEDKYLSLFVVQWDLLRHTSDTFRGSPTGRGPAVLMCNRVTDTPHLSLLSLSFPTSSLVFPRTASQIIYLLSIICL